MTATAAIGPELLDAVAARLRKGQRVRRLLPGGGRIHVDRTVPFLCLHRGDPDGDAAQLVVSQSAYLLASPQDAADPGLAQLVAVIARELRAHTGAFLLLEVWEAPHAPATERPHRIAPRMRLVASEPQDLAASLERLERALGGLRLAGTRTPAVERATAATVAPPGAEPLLPCPAPEGCFALGLGLDPYYRDEAEGIRYPMLLLQLAEALSDVLLKTFHAFAGERTSVRPEHYFALGRRTLGRAAWNADRRLEAVSRTFDLLLLVSPINTDQAWEDLRESGFRRAPRFLYRPLTVDPQIAKRDLFAIPLERVEDPLMARLFREKQEEMDRQVTLLVDRGSPRFLQGSLQLYGGVEGSLLDLALRILRDVERGDGDDGEVGEVAEAREMVELARAEIAAYRRSYRGFEALVELRGDLTSALLVSKDRLLVAASARFPRHRVPALLHHEVGTHLLTYCNGKAQRIRQFQAGLAGYEALQEGVAVMAELLSGGLSPARLRVLAGRVVACHLLLEGADFLQTFHHLVDEHRFRHRQAFWIATRVFRGGGLTKDAVYLRGLVQLTDYLRRGGELEPLFVGKIATRHLPVVRELYYRNFFRRPPVRPRYLSSAAAQRRLVAVRESEDLLAAWWQPRRERQEETA